MKSKQGKKRRKDQVFTALQRNINTDIPGAWSEFPVLTRIVINGPLWYRSMWATALLFCWTLNMYQLWDRVQFYLSSPIRTSVSISRTEHIRYPSITACHDLFISQTALQLRDQLAAQFGKEHCEFNDARHFYYLFQEAGVNYTRMVELNKKDRTFRHICEIAGSSGPFMCNSTKMVYPLTSCITLTSHNFYYTFNQETDFGIVWRPAANNCSRSAKLLQMVIHDDESEPAIQFWQHLRSGNAFTVAYSYNKHEVIPLSVTQFTYVSTPANPCVDNDTYKRCIHDYIHGSVTTANITCSFPGLGKQRDETCDDFTDAFQAFGKIAMTFARRKNPCPRRCQETLYRRSLGRKIEGDGSFAVLLVFLDNVITTSEEYFVYTLVSLLCDIGGNVGLFLDVCVLSMFEITEAIVKRVMLASYVHPSLQF